MPKKSRRPKGRSRKWSRANIMNFAAGSIVVVSMVLGSVFVFGGASQQPAATVPTAPIITSAPPTVVPQSSTPTVVVSPAAVTPTPAPPTPTP
jgi:hypothetical protein